MHRSKLLASLLCLTIAGVAPAAAEAHGKKDLRGKTTLALDAGTAAALTSAGIAVSPLRPASAGAAGIAFPIVGGKVATDPVGGRIKHSGGLKLADADTTLKLRDFVIRLDADPDLTAKAGGARVSILDLDLSQAQLDRQRRRLTVTGVRATLSADGAAALNATFGLSLAAGTPIGTATVELKIGGKGRHHDDSDHHGDRDSDSDD